LEQEQVEMLISLVEEAQALDRAQRRFYLSRTDGPDVIHGPGGSTREVLGEDVHDLIDAGFLDRRGSWVGGDTEFTIAPMATEFVAELAKADPVGKIEEEVVRRYMEGESFAAAYPIAHARWREAANLLWGPEAEKELTTIGHKTR
jgi:hypothetical protein